MTLEYRNRSEYGYIFISNKQCRGEDVLVYYDEIAAVLNEGATETASPDATLQSKWHRLGAYMVITQTADNTYDPMYNDVVTLRVPTYELRKHLDNR